ncbi:MAG: hypothetical protein IJU45_04670 [Clostridia bacterium]|nr:hypothetical protein [Clostridia bacterium]
MNKGRKRIAVIIISIVAVIAVVSGSLAWYSSTTSMSQRAKLSGFQSAGYVYFETEGGNYKAVADDNGLYALSLDPAARNYVGNLRINVIQKGYAKYYVRVKMNVQWTMPDGTIAQNVTLPFTFDKQWFDNRAEDYCVYYTETAGLFDNYDKSIITGFDEEEFLKSSLTESAVPKIAVAVESVQINRYSQIWGIEKLPWE